MAKNDAVKKVLVIGKSGQLGKEVESIFQKDNKYDVLAPEEKDADITNEERMIAITSEYKPDVIVNCAAYTNVDNCETKYDLAKRINADGPKNLAKAAAKENSFLLHISTDYVYDGTTKFQGVTHKTHFEHEKPLNKYGLTKLDGENNIKNEFEDKDQYGFAILRTSGLYGRYGNNFLKKMTQVFYEEYKPRKLICDQWYCPTSAYQLAKQIKIWADLSKEDREYIINREGNIFNANNIGFTSPYLFLSEYFSLFGYCGFLDAIEKITFYNYFLNKDTARRPKSVVMENELAKKYGSELNAFTTIDEALEEYVRIEQNKQMFM